jgi:hypothetical protein
MSRLLPASYWPFSVFSKAIGPLAALSFHVSDDRSDQPRKICVSDSEFRFERPTHAREENNVTQRGIPCRRAPSHHECTRMSAHNVGEALHAT